MTALQLVIKIMYEKLGLNDTITALANPTQTISQVLWAINEIQRDLAGVMDLTKLKEQGEITLATNDTLYSLASNFLRFIKGDDAVYYTKVNTGTTEIAKFTIANDEDFKNHNTDLNITEGKPYIGRLWGSDSNGYSQLEVYGTPTVTYNGTKLYYEYIKVSTDLVADADLSPFPDHLLIEGGYLKIKISDGEADRSDLGDFLTAASGMQMHNSSGRKRKLKYRDY